MEDFNRDKFPPIVNGKPIIDLDSQKFLKVWQGPQHPGVTGNMALEVTLSGDEVVDLKTHVGYLHRGFEKLMERRKYLQCFTIVCRICVPEPNTNEYVFAAAVEDLAGIKVPEKALWLRTLTLEMSRLASFLMWIGGQAGSLGMGTIAQWTVAQRDYILDLFEELTGGRVYHMYIVPGGVRGDVPEGFFEHVEDVMKGVEKVLADVEIALLNNAIFKKRAKGLGIISQDMVDEYGIVGPNARAAGFVRDIRKDTPYAAYDQLDFTVITGTKSDALERTYVRFQEMLQCVSLIRQIAKRIPRKGAFYTQIPNPLHWKIPAGETYIRAEASRGEYGYYMVSDGSEYPRRVQVRGPSYTHAIAVLEKLAVGTNLADLAGLMVSLHTCPPEIER